MKKFRNEHFNELYELMKRMDSSDDYLMIQVSALNQNKANMEMCIATTGRSGGKPGIKRLDAEAVLIMAMRKNEYLKRLLTDAVMYYKMLQAQA